MKRSRQAEGNEDVQDDQPEPDTIISSSLRRYPVNNHNLGSISYTPPQTSSNIEILSSLLESSSPSQVASEISCAGSDKRFKGKGGIPSRVRPILATAHSPKSPAQQKRIMLKRIKRPASLSLPTSSFPAPSAAPLGSTATQPDTMIAPIPLEAISEARNVLTAMKSWLGKEDEARVEEYLLIAIQVLRPCKNAHFLLLRRWNAGYGEGGGNSVGLLV
jgi:hypothetical protein